MSLLDDLFPGYDDPVTVQAFPQSLYGGKVIRLGGHVEIAVTDNGVGDKGATVFTVERARMFALAILEVCDG